MKEDISIGDYLTLLVHLGVLSERRTEDSVGAIFKCASGSYRALHLAPLLDILKLSLGEL
jgi:hypothetical protein